MSRSDKINRDIAQMDIYIDKLMFGSHITLSYETCYRLAYNLTRELPKSTMIDLYNNWLNKMINNRASNECIQMFYDIFMHPIHSFGISINRELGK